MIKETINLKEHCFPHYFLHLYISKDLKPDRFSYHVVQFKNGVDYQIEMFKDEIVELIKEEKLEFDVAIPVPRSSKNRISKGSKTLVEAISQEFKVENGVGILERTESVSSSHSGGLRSQEKHYKSITCKKDMSNKRILLFDDVKTTGSTARACIQKLLEENCTNIILITLGRTAWASEV